MYCKNNLGESSRESWDGVLLHEWAFMSSLGQPDQTSLKTVFVRRPEGNERAVFLPGKIVLCFRKSLDSFCVSEPKWFYFVLWFYHFYTLVTPKFSFMYNFYVFVYHLKLSVKKKKITKTFKKEQNNLQSSWRLSDLTSNPSTGASVSYCAH